MPLDSLAFTGCVGGQMPPSGATQGGKVFFDDAEEVDEVLVAGGGADSVDRFASGGVCIGSSPITINPGSSVTIGSTPGSGICTGAGVAAGDWSGGHASGVGPSDP